MGNGSKISSKSASPETLERTEKHLTPWEMYELLKITYHHDTSNSQRPSTDSTATESSLSSGSELESDSIDFRSVSSNTKLSLTEEFKRLFEEYVKEFYPSTDKKKTFSNEDLLKKIHYQYNMLILGAILRQYSQTEYAEIDKWVVNPNEINISFNKDSYNSSSFKAIFSETRYFNQEDLYANVKDLQENFYVYLTEHHQKIKQYRFINSLKLELDKEVQCDNNKQLDKGFFIEKLHDHLNAESSVSNNMSTEDIDFDSKDLKLNKGSLFESLKTKKDEYSKKTNREIFIEIIKKSGEKPLNYQKKPLDYQKLNELFSVELHEVEWRNLLNSVKTTEEKNEINFQSITVSQKQLKRAESLKQKLNKNLKSKGFAQFFYGFMNFLDLDGRHVELEGILKNYFINNKVKLAPIVIELLLSYTDQMQSLIDKSIAFNSIIKVRDNNLLKTVGNIVRSEPVRSFKNSLMALKEATGEKLNLKIDKLFEEEQKELYNEEELKELCNNTDIKELNQGYLEALKNFIKHYPSQEIKDTKDTKVSQSQNKELERILISGLGKKESYDFLLAELFALYPKSMKNLQKSIDTKCTNIKNSKSNTLFLSARHSGVQNRGEGNATVPGVGKIGR